MGENADDAFFEDGIGLQRAENNLWEKMKISRFKDGFSDGKFLGEEKALQEGFNEGYRRGFEYSFRVAVMRGITGALETNLKGSNLQYLHQANELKRQIAELEHRCIENKKVIVSDIQNFESKNCNTLDVDDLETSETGHQFTSEDARKVNSSDYPIGSSDKEDMKNITEELNLIKDKLVVFMEECGYSKMAKLIVKELF